MAIERRDREDDDLVRIYLSDCRRLFARSDWRPRRGARQVLEDVHQWIKQNESAVRAALG